MIALKLEGIWLGWMDRDPRKEVRLTLVHDGPVNTAHIKFGSLIGFAAGTPERVSHEFGPILKRSIDQANSGESFG